ncbi:MAG: hypothetical protein M3T55_00800, partial [Pseudomonadota bacterium]|nr:hypothetical protein [Pseudomonadota bacterium]
MSADTFAQAADEAKQARKSANSAADHGQNAINDAVAAGERAIAEAVRTAERVFKDGVETLRAQTRVYTDNAGAHVEEAQRYVMERVKERPLTATLTGLGVGLLLGLL